MNDEKDVDLMRLVNIGLTTKWSILGIGLASAVIAFSASFLFTPVFHAETLLLNAPVEKRGDNILSALGSSGSGLAALAGLGGGGDSNTQEAIAILKSRALVDQFIADGNLLPILFDDRWDAANKKWKSKWWDIFGSDNPAPGADKAYEKFNKQIRRVEEDRRTGLVTLSIEWSDPKLAAEWAAELVKRANALLRNTAIERSEKSLDFLNEQIKKSGEVEVRQAIYKLIDSELKREMFAKVNEDYAFKIIDPPTVPEKKTRPKRSLYALFGFIVGGSIAYALALRRSTWVRPARL